MDSFDQKRKGIRQIAILALSALVAGCGYAEYETRLSETRKYYVYLEKLELALSPKWSAAGGVMDLRVPRQFQLLPPPPVVERDGGAKEEAGVDMRQPDYHNIKLPGLFGAWQSSFNVVKPSGSESCRGFIYALSNYESLALKDGIEGQVFLDKLKAKLKDALNVEPKDEPVETFPPGIPNSQYQTQYTYEVCRFRDAEIKAGKENAKYTFELYSRLQGPIVGIVLIVLPVEMEAPQKVSERIPLMMASFNFTKNPPQPGSPVGGGNPPAKPTGPSF